MNHNNCRHSFSWGDYQRDRDLDARADRIEAQRQEATMGETRTRLVATIHQNLDTGMWFVRTSGNGDSHENLLTSPLYAERLLSARVEDGFSIEDPEHYCDLYGVLAGPGSQYEDSADSAEAAAAAMVGSGPGDDGRGLATDDELVF